MRGISLALVLAAALMLPTRAAYAVPMTFVADLLGTNEVPSTGSPGIGHATVVIDPVGNTMHIDVTFSGLTTGTTAAHIHCCLPFPGATGVSVGVATTFPTFPGFPLGVTAGTYSHDFNLLDLTTYNPPFVTAHGGTVALAEAGLVAGIQSDETYLNIHTSAFPTGEIRGLIVLPQPASLLLLGAGLVGLACITWRRHRSK